ncbi:hypothetical protein A3Q56_03892 [Intoshia linei]|uniref:THIF-type NAD/FAD binding fold domain-containing protein n=1 Tax=Intoshia linei TaxID=1819745 RepID=A0A177B428_9BILA|nr:hypothetical protein A3Q56_03892 [Intoshia linei]
MRNSLLNFLKCDRHFQPLHFNSKLNIRLYIKTVNVLIVGAGGLGCETVKNLIGLGFNSLTIVDMDTIELTNLNRQFLFRESDIGNSKAITVQNYVKKIYPNVDIIGNNVSDPPTERDTWLGLALAVPDLYTDLHERTDRGHDAGMTNFF